MALDPNIALQVRGIELQNPLAQYGQIAQLQSAQNQNALARYQLSSAQRADEQQNKLYADAQQPDFKLDFKSAVQYGAPGIAAYKAQQDAENARTEGSIKQTKLLTDKLALLPEAYKRADTPEAYLALHQSVHADPVLGPWLKSTGATPEKGLATLQNAIQTGKFDELRMGSMQSVSQILDSMKPQVVAPGSTLVQGGKAVFTAPSAPAAPTNLAKLQNELAALPPGDPRIPQYNALIRKETTHAPGTTVQLPPQEKAEQADRGKMLVAEYNDISKAAKLAAKTLPSIDANLRILDKGFSTGFGTETKAAGASVLAALGVADADKFATNAQVFQAKATEAVLQKQLEQKGPQTESDAKRIDMIGSQLGKTTGGNKFLLTTAKEQLKRDMEQRAFYDKWWKNNKTYDGAEDAWFAGEGGKSLFDRPALKQYAAPTESAAAQIPTSATPARAAPAAAAIPQGAIDALKAGRGTDAQFDEMFGPGAAKRARGGK